MSPNLPSAYLWIMNQLLLPPLEQLTPPKLAFLGCNCHNINSTEVFHLESLPHPCMGPHKESRHEKCSQGRAREEAPAGRAQVSHFADTLMSGTRPCTTTLQSAREDFSCGPCCTWMGDFVCTKKASVLQMDIFFIF